MKLTRITIRLPFAVLLAASVLAGCSKEPAPAPEPGERMAVHFTLPGIEGKPEVASAAEAPQTKAALDEYATVRIVAYRHAAGTPSADNYIAEQTYAADAAGALSPCKVDASGNFQSFDASAALMLPGGTYDFYAVTPALPLGNRTTVSVQHGVDYATSVTDNGGAGFTFSLSDLPASNVTLTTLQRQCAKIELVVMRDASFAGMTSLVVNPQGSGVTLSSLSTSPLAAGIGAALTPTPSPLPAAKYNVAPARFTQSDATTARTTVYVLPKVAADLGISFALKYTLNKVETNKTVSGKVSGIALDPGGSYRFTLTLSSPGATLTVTDWIDGGTQDNDMGA